MKTDIKILLVEDSEDDTLLLLHHLSKGGYNVEYERVETALEMQRALNEKSWDIILSDYMMPSFNGLKALELLKETKIDLPFIIVSGTIGEEVAVNAMRAGAHDYLMKNNLKRLIPAIEREIRESLSRAEQRKLAQKQKESEALLFESEERYRLIAENTADTISLLDLNLNILYISPSVQKLRGYSVEEAYKQQLNQIFTPESLKKIQTLFAEQLSFETAGKADPSGTKSLELEEYCKDGSIIWVEIAASFIRDQNLRPVQILTVTRDITERKRSEEKLRKLIRAVEQSPVSIMITNTNGNIEYVNSKFAELTGYSVEEVQGLNPRFLKSGDMPQEYYRHIWQTITAGKEWNGELHNKKKSGELYWELASISPILDHSGIITHFLAVKEDITNRKKSEEELLEAKELAEESSRLKTEFLHNMSHEIRTPMNGIIGYSQLLNSPDLSVENQKQYTKIIVSSSEQLLKIIDDILEISELQTRQIKTVDKKTSLNDLLSVLYSKFDRQASEKGISLHFKQGLPDSMSSVFTDESKLKKILNNLVENAIKFTQTGYVEIGYQLVENKIKIYIKDTGIGICPENHEIIFERFSQEAKGLTRFYGGLGLGLSIAKENAELLGGEITLKSEKGKGSTFFVTIPYKPASSDTKHPESEVNTQKKAVKGNCCTVLIAEDEELNYLYLETLIKRNSEEIKVLRAKNGKEAVEICTDHKGIDLVLMDIKMPVMNGYEATRRIKSFLPGLPIVAQTAYTTSEDRNNSISAGCDEFISKPISFKTMDSVIARYLSNKLLQ